MNIIARKEFTREQPICSLCHKAIGLQKYYFVNVEREPSRLTGNGSVMCEKCCAEVLPEHDVGVN